MGYQGYEELVVWQKAIDLVVEVYKLVKKLPREEQYALSDQMRRAVTSIPSNIAEGQVRNSQNELIQFLSIAQGSRAEIQTQLLICHRLGYLTEIESQTALDLTNEIGKMLTSFIVKLKSV